MYLTRFVRARDVFVKQYNNNILYGFRRFFEAGKLEIITCCATHGFLPLMNINLNAVRAQVEIGCREFERHFGKRPQGIWLAECGYAEGVDEILRDSGIRYFFVDTHGVLFAEPRPKYGVYAPIMCPKSGVFCMGRDHESSKQVWSAIEGYPGDYVYREFYRDIGFDLDYDYVKPHLHQTGIRTNTGMKYYKITGRGSHKEAYQPQVALDKASDHAANFMFNREKQVEWLSGHMDRPPVILAPYDAELYMGHWWFEGPDWINFLLRKMHWDQQTVKMITIPQYLDQYKKIQITQPSASELGPLAATPNAGWKAPTTGSIAICTRAPTAWSNWRRRSLDNGNATRHRTGASTKASPRIPELAHQSDWAFIMKTGTMVEYACERTKVHVLNFNHLYEQIKKNEIDESWLSQIELTA